MDEQLTQKVRAISREIVHNEFPDEEEYFDFLFDLTMQEIEELEPGKEADFLREMRAVHPELVLGYTPIIIILAVQVLGGFTHGIVAARHLIKKRIANILGDENSEKIPLISQYLEEYLEQQRRAKKD